MFLRTLTFKLLLIYTLTLGGCIHAYIPHTQLSVDYFQLYLPQKFQSQNNQNSASKTLFKGAPLLYFLFS